MESKLHSVCDIINSILKNMGRVWMVFLTKINNKKLANAKMAMPRKSSLLNHMIKVNELNIKK
jgi:hypothetical protein